MKGMLSPAGPAIEKGFYNLICMALCLEVALTQESDAAVLHLPIPGTLRKISGMGDSSQRFAEQHCDSVK